MKFNTIIGQAARGEHYLPRPQITNEIWDKLNSGSNLLLVAPRRVGKSSILFNLLDNPKENHIVVYYTSESVNNENEFYRKMFNHIIEKFNAFEKYQKKLTALGKTFFRSIKSLGKDGIEFRHDITLDYYNEIMSLIKNLDLGNDKMIVVVDEFAQSVENIIKDESDKNAIHFLETNREIRQRPETHNKLQFIYAGSIGIENVAARIDGINFINDLVPISVPPVNRKEANALIEQIIKDSGASFPAEARTNLLNFIEWWIPFYFEIILDEAAKVLTERESEVITWNSLEEAIKRILKQRIYFEHWFTRLRSAFEGDDFSFIKEVLNCMSGLREYSSAEVYNTAVKYKLENSYNNLLNTLKHDGYINNDDNPKIYRFNSPLLREWWYKNVAN